jgi:hypothetical protein
MWIVFVDHYTSLSALEILFPFRIIYHFLTLLSCNNSNYYYCYYYRIEKIILKLLLVQCLNKHYYSVLYSIQFTVAHFKAFKISLKYVYCMYAFHFVNHCISLEVIIVHLKIYLIWLLELSHNGLLVSWGIVYVFIEVALLTQIYFFINKFTEFCSYIVLQFVFEAFNYDSSTRYISITY